MDSLYRTQLKLHKDLFKAIYGYPMEQYFKRHKQKLVLVRKRNSKEISHVLIRGPEVKGFGV